MYSGREFVRPPTLRDEDREASPDNPSTCVQPGSSWNDLTAAPGAFDKSSNLTVQTGYVCPWRVLQTGAVAISSLNIDLDVQADVSLGKAKHQSTSFDQVKINLDLPYDNYHAAVKLNS